MNIGENIKKYRKLKKLTQKQLAQSVGKSEITIRKYENNNTKPPLDVIDKIAKTLDVTSNDLIESKKSIGANIKKERRLNNLTQEELAEKSNLSEDIIKKYENDEIRPDIKILKNIANALDVSYTSFFTGILPQDLFKIIPIDELLGQKQAERIKKVEIYNRNIKPSDRNIANFHEKVMSDSLSDEDIKQIEYYKNKEISEKIILSALNGVMALAEYASLNDEVQILQEASKNDLLKLLDELSIFLEYELLKITKSIDESKDK